MLNLDQNYITTKFSLPKTTILVVLDGVYQPQLSSSIANAIIGEKTLKIPKNTKINLPIHLLFFASQNCCNSFDIIAEEDSYTTIIEEHASLGDGQYTSEIKINITAKANSEIVHYKLQLENITQATHQNTINIDQATGSRIISNFINKGAKTSQDTLYIKLAGENAAIDIKGINLLRDHQNMNCHIKIEHQKPNCISNVLFKSVIDDQAINNFACRVIAHNGATKTETHVTNKNLLLSELATANTSPEMEVYVDDVICTHGATVGQLDAEALFYLRSRGITKNMAIAMLISAFVQEIVDQFAKYDRFKIAAELYPA